VNGVNRAFKCFIRRNTRSIIIRAPRRERPSVICARLNPVQLIPAARAVLMLPECVGLRIISEALDIAVAQRIDLRFKCSPIFGLSNERIILRDRPLEDWREK